METSEVIKECIRLIWEYGEKGTDLGPEILKFILNNFCTIDEKEKVDHLLAELAVLDEVGLVEYPNDIESCKHLIYFHQHHISQLKKKVEELWEKPVCRNCVHRDSPCVPDPWDCTGFIEDKNGRT